MTDCLVDRVDRGSETGIKESRRELMSWGKTGAFNKSETTKRMVKCRFINSERG